MGLYCMVLGGMVIVVCISAWVRGDGVLFMIDCNDGCGVVVCLGCHASPMG